MWSRYCAFVAAVSFSVAPALADVVDITVSGAVSGSGTAFSACGACDGGFDVHSFDFTGSNSQLGSFSASGQTSASGAPTFGDFVTLTGSTQQTTATSVNSLTIDFLVSAVTDGLGAQWFAQAHLSSEYGLAFTLTTPSLMHLTTTGKESGLSSWSLNGPFLGSFSGSDFGSFDQTFIAEPGAYSLTILDRLDSSAFPLGIDTHLEETDSFSLTANFAPIVPEPRWSAIVLVLLAIVSGGGSLKRRRQT